MQSTSTEAGGRELCFDSMSEQPAPPPLPSGGISRPSKGALSKAFVCAAVLYGLIALLLVVLRVSNLVYWLGHSFAPCLLAAIITGLWGHFSKKPWSWLRVGLTVFVFHFIFASLGAAGSRAKDLGSATAMAIDRKAFSFSLPPRWTELRNETYDGEQFSFFQGRSTCLLSLVIRPKSDQVSAASLLEVMTKEMKKQLSGVSTTDFTSWGKYQGTGQALEGTIKNEKCVSSAFGFEGDTYVGVVTEFSGLADQKKYQNDFEQIRQSFRLK
jgi:hypothetical protein